MIEKFEACPQCDTHTLLWNYDGQRCSKCGYPKKDEYGFTKDTRINHPYHCVKEFHTKFVRPIAQQLCNMDDPDPKVQKLIGLRYDLIYEEMCEFYNAYADNNEIECLDALCDLVYVIYGMAISMGWDINAAFAEVHRSNMSKLGADGNPIVREDGKILKGENYSPPDLAQFFKR